MGVQLGGIGDAVIVWCSHRHDEGEPCTDGCVHSPRCEGDDMVGVV